MKNSLMSILEDNGLQYNDDLLIGEVDSFLHMSLLVEIEEAMDMEFPEELLGQNIFSSFSRLYQIIYEIKNK